MTIDWLSKCSDWNPQLFRELKGRLKRRNIMLAIITSLVLQLLVLLYFWAMLPVGHPYWWPSVYQILGLVMTYGPLFAGVYLLIRDVGKEERRGTLNFIRLSPQTSQSILIGKLLGVPVMAYLVVVLAVPLHLFAAIAAHVPIAHMLIIYLLTAAACAFFYTGALVYAFLGGVQGWVGVFVIGLSCTIFFQLWSKAFVTNGVGFLGLSQWFHLPVGRNLSFGLTFVLISLGTGTYWLWEAVNRRFRNSSLTLLSKSQSYRMTLCFEIWLLGFFIRDVGSNYNRPLEDWILGFIFRDVYPNSYHPFTFERPFEDLLLLGCFNLLWFVVLIVALTPQRAMLLDWARYRRKRVASAEQFWSFSVVKDLVWGEKSPALVAIALNLLLEIAVVIPWVLSWKHTGSPFQNVVTIILSVTYLSICATIAQLMMLMKSPKRAIWAASTIASVIFLPLTILGLLQLNPTQAPLAWLFSMGAFATLHSSISMPMIFTAFLGHLGILSALVLSLTFQLQRAGESETKALLASA